MERYLLKIEVPSEDFPDVEVVEYGMRERFECAGYAYVVDDTILVEYKIKSISSLPQNKTES